MQRLAAPLSLALLALAGCGPSYPPLVCDPARAGELAFGYQVVGTFTVPPGTEATGQELLFIDRACRYYAVPAWGGRVLTGVLAGPLLDEINADLLTSRWREVDGARVRGGIDDSVVTLARDDLTATSGSVCMDCTAAHRDLFVRARAWTMRLGEAGEAFDGAVRLQLMEPTIPMLSLVVAPWTGSSLASAVTSPGTRTTLVMTSPDDTRALRALRERGANGLEWDGHTFYFVAVDAIPVADADGCVRLPPFLAPTCIGREL